MAAHIDPPPAPTTAELRTQWNQLSDWYEAKCTQMTGKIFRAFVDFLRLSEAKVVVETACGTGNGIAILRSVSPPETKILASDLSDSFVLKASAQHFPNTEICIASAEDLPYPDHACDRYVSNLALMLVENPSRMLSEAYRVLRPGGLLAISLWGTKSGCTLFAPAFEALALTGLSMPAPSVRSNFHLSDPAVLTAMFRTAGFPHPLIFTENSHLPTIDPDDLVDYFVTSPDMRRIFDVAGSEASDRFKSNLRAVTTRMLREEGRTPVFEAFVVVAEKPREERQQ